jgi:hypothetical protein
VVKKLFDAKLWFLAKPIFSLFLSEVLKCYAITILQQLVAKLASQSKFRTFAVAEFRRLNNRPLGSVAKKNKKRETCAKSREIFL